MTFGAGFAQKRHRGRVFGLVRDQLAGQRGRVADGRDERCVAVAEPRFLARAALHREQRLGQLLRLRGDALEEGAGAFAGRSLLLPRRLERVDERAEVAVQSLEIAGDGVLGNVRLDGQRTRFER